MDSAQIMNIISLIILLILSSLFSCSETAFLSVSKIKIRTLAEEGNKKAKLVESLLDNQDRLLSAILVGNNLVNIGASSLTTATIMAIFGDGAQTVAIATGVVTLCILIFGEITPKSLATQNADKLVFALAPFIRFVCIITKPVVFVLNIITGFIIKLLGGNQEHGPSLTEEELKTIVTVGHEEGVLEKEEKEMIHNVFEFGETEIKEIMTPRIHVESLPEDCTYDELMNVYHDAQYSRYPIHDESFDEIIGVLNMKDLLFIDIDKEHFDVKKSSVLLCNFAIWFVDYLRRDMIKALKASKRFDAPHPIDQIAKKATEIVSIGNMTGEGWFLTGEMIELIHNGAGNIVCCQPFACLPNHIVGKGVIKSLRHAYPDANIVAIDYDPGASEVNQVNRIKLMLATARKNMEENDNK